MRLPQKALQKYKKYFKFLNFSDEFQKLEISPIFFIFLCYYFFYLAAFFI